MATEKKLLALERIYARYEEYTRQLRVACQKYCAHCCTCNVTMTSLEAAYIRKALSDAEWAAIRQRLAPQLEKIRYQPEITLNQMAGLCANSQEPPEEIIDPNWGACPLLEKKACPIYSVRPFGCRCLLSGRNCGDSGYAEIDAYTITVNYVFTQFIEHLDQSGKTGNLSDILMATDPETAAAGASIHDSAAGCHVIRNRAIPMLLVPPEHQRDIASIVNDLHAIVESA
ncbi:MAG: hypothetical protein U5L07_15460 [Desulfobacterales bacterium]|nr:hypothetical protein [Desulfobacterales bacterium]